MQKQVAFQSKQDYCISGRLGVNGGGWKHIYTPEIPRDQTPIYIYIVETDGQEQCMHHTCQCAFIDPQPKSASPTEPLLT